MRAVNAENGHDQHAPIIGKMLSTDPDAYMRGLSHTCPRGKNNQNKLTVTRPANLRGAGVCTVINDPDSAFFGTTSGSTNGGPADRMRRAVGPTRNTKM